MNRENLIKLEEFERDREVDMGTYYGHNLDDSSVLIHRCDTAGCHAGYASALAGGCPSGQCEGVAGQFLGLNLRQQYFLFDQFSVLRGGFEPCEDREARLRLRVMIESPDDNPTECALVELLRDRMEAEVCV